MFLFYIACPINFQALLDIGPEAGSDFLDFVFSCHCSLIFAAFIHLLSSCHCSARNIPLRLMQDEGPFPLLPNERTPVVLGIAYPRNLPQLGKSLLLARPQLCHVLLLARRRFDLSLYSCCPHVRRRVGGLPEGLAIKSHIFKHIFKQVAGLQQDL